jgi:hypothetical protein
MKTLSSCVPLILSVVFLCFSTGCKKNSVDRMIPETEYYLHCKIDGVKKEFKVTDSAYLPATSLNGIYSLGIGGVDNISTMNQLSVIINDGTGKPITTGKTYTTIAPGDITQVQVVIFYSNLGGEYYTSAFLPDNPSYESAEITLSEITDKYVKGTFKGKLLVDASASPAVKYNITEGEFYLPRSKNPVKKSSTKNGNGYMEGTLNGKKLMIDESADELASVWAGFEESEINGTKLYGFFIGGASNILLNSYNNILLVFTDVTPFNKGEKTMLFNSDSNIPVMFGGGIQYKDISGNLVTYSGLIDASTVFLGIDGSATVNITKFSTTKGDYIEGTFSIKNGFFPQYSNEAYSLTGGKFRAKID